MELGNLLYGNSRGEFPVDPDLDDGWGEWMDANGFTRHGGREIGKTYERVTETEVFRMEAYYWGDCTCGYQDDDFNELREGGHTPDCPIVRPNFLYKPTGFTMKWYKYPLRDAYSNAPLTRELMREMLAHCAASLA